MIAASAMGWQMNFVCIAIISLILAVVVSWQLGAQRQHLAELRAWGWSEQHAAVIELVTARSSVLAFLLIASASCAALLISPNLAVFAVHNVGLSPERLAHVYLLGGVMAVLAMPLTGRLVDNFGATPVSIAVAVITTGLLVAGFIDRRAFDLPAVPLFALIIVFQLVRSTVQPGLGDSGAGRWGARGISSPHRCGHQSCASRGSGQRTVPARPFARRTACRNGRRCPAGARDDLGCSPLLLMLDHAAGQPAVSSASQEPAVRIPEKDSAMRDELLHDNETSLPQVYTMGVDDVPARA